MAGMPAQAGEGAFGWVYTLDLQPKGTAEFEQKVDVTHGQAAGRYERGHAPRVGAVLAFQSTRRMRVGHVAMVSKVVSDREVLLTHANWSRPGGIERDVRAVDVSAAGDWSEVKVWYGPTGGLGTSSYPTNGFIYSGHAPAAEAAPAVDTTIIATAAAVPVVPVAGE